jgi:CRP-like cAMP-binding protein
MVKISSVLNSLQESDVFKGLTIEQYDEVLKKSLHKKLPPKSILFHQGDPASMCFLVNHGRLKLTMLNEQGKEVIIRYIGAGELTAAVAVLKDWNYPVTAESVETSEVIGWDKPTILGLMKNFPNIAINIVSMLLERLDDIQHRYFELSTEQVEKRIARTLLRLMRSAGSKTSEGIDITIPLSRQNIAEYSGTTLFTASRTLSIWEKSGWIKSGRERITVTDPHALVSFAEKG